MDVVVLAKKRLACLLHLCLHASRKMGDLDATQRRDSVHLPFAARCGRFFHPGAVCLTRAWSWRLATSMPPPAGFALAD